MALGPSHRRDQGRAEPAQTAGLLKAAPARTDGVPVHGTAAELRSPATFDRGIFAGIAEFERALIHERTSVGRTAAKDRGVRFGRPPKFNAEQQRRALRLIEEGKSVGEVARTFGVHPATAYRLTPNTAPKR